MVSETDIRNGSINILQDDYILDNKSNIVDFGNAEFPDIMLDYYLDEVIRMYKYALHGSEH